MGRFFPAEWEAFRSQIPERLRHLRPVDAYSNLLFDPAPEVHEPAAAAWCRWEDAPWRLHQAWRDSELIIIEHEGHGGRSMTETCGGILASLGNHSR